MGNYFEDVYLKRMNIDGRNIQERVKTRKEKEFERIFLSKTKYQATIYQLNEEQTDIICSIQPNKWGQDKIVSNILIPVKKAIMKVGDIIYSYQKVKESENDCCWLIYYQNPDLSKGYVAYEAIELNSVINYTDEYGETIEKIPVKFVNETSVFVQDKFMSYGDVSYREPLAHRKFITKDLPILKKGKYFSFKQRGWEIVGLDNLSIDGVAYVSIAECLKREPEPDTSKEILVGENDNFFLINS